MEHTCNPTTERLRQEDHEFKACLDCIRRTRLRTKAKRHLERTMPMRRVGDPWAHPTFMAA